VNGAGLPLDALRLRKALHDVGREVLVVVQKNTRVARLHEQHVGLLLDLGQHIGPVLKTQRVAACNGLHAPRQLAAEKVAQAHDVK